jgi:eukaryotic-like serine/threonine-protein kinase
VEIVPPRIGRYDISRQLGRGTMGIVYEAHDPLLGRRVALKTIDLAFAASPDERQGFEQRFLSEARVAARLSHPNIVAVHDVGRDEPAGALYVAFEYLEGHTLAEMLARGPLPWRQALTIVEEVAGALAHAHSHGVVHRDIKPANIMVLASGIPKIMDFGIAKVETARLKPAGAGQHFGTPLYMAPEQVRDQPVDGRTDLWALGAVAYELLTGQAAFAAPTPPAILQRVLSETPPRPSQWVPGIPRDAEEVVARALAKSPEDRYPNGTALAEDVQDVRIGRPPRHRRQLELEAAETPLPPPRPPVPRPAPSPRRPAGAPGPAAPPPRQPAPRHAVPPRTRRLPYTILAILGIGAVFAGGYFLGGSQSLRTTIPSPSPTAPSATAAGSPPDSPSAPPQPELSVAPPTTERPDLVPATTLPLADARAAYGELAPPSSTAPVVSPRAQLSLRLEHSLESGTVRVWVDDDLRIDEALDSRVTKKIVILTKRKGLLEQVLDVKPGHRVVKVEVAWDDNIKAKRITGTFAPDQTLHLDARVGGLIKRDLSLEWR